MGRFTRFVPALAVGVLIAAMGAACTTASDTGDSGGSAILVAHRSDESGTTKVFTSWLSAESPEWDSKIGADKAVQWPVGTGGDGNDGVAASISQTEGTIGYLSFDFAVSSGLGIAQIQGDGGTYITPSVQAISAAGGDLKFPITEDTSILNSSAPGAYPISTTTYLLIYKDLSILGNKDQAQTLVDFLHWALTEGQSKVEALNYAPLPSAIQQEALKQLDELNYQGQPLTASTGASFKGAALTGAGATFPDPIYETWFKDFQQVEPDAKINYQAIGSGGGVEQFTAKTVDFGASDAPLKDEEQSNLPAEAIQIPTVLGGVVIAYNVKGVDTGLKLDGATAADIFLGKITKWDAEAIAKPNPGVELPA